MRIKNKKRGFSVAFLRIFAGLLVIGLLVAADCAVRPVIRTVASSQMQIYITSIVQQAVQQTLEQKEIQYTSVVTLTQNENGNTTALITDTVALNRLQSDILNAVITRINGYQSMTVAIPLGTLLGGQWLAGLGPDVTFRLIPAGTVRTRIENSFSASGINQTHHQIRLIVLIDMTAVIPGYRVSDEIETTVVLAETVIVGLVPDAYTEVYGGTDELIGMLQDYGAAEG